MQKSNIHNEKSGMLLPIAKALGIAVAAGIVLAAIFCFAALRFDDPEKGIGDIRIYRACRRSIRRGISRIENVRGKGRALRAYPRAVACGADDTALLCLFPACFAACLRGERRMRGGACHARRQMRGKRIGQKEKTEEKKMIYGCINK